MRIFNGRMCIAFAGCRAAAVGLLALFLLGHFVSPAKADADQEQCSCNLKISGIAKAGSRTANAAACVRHQFQNWCEIYVATLENTPQQKELVFSVLNVGAPGNPVSPANLFLRLFEDYVKYSSPRNQIPMAHQIEADRAKLESLMNDKANAVLLAKCIDGFRSKEVVNYQGNSFSCSVGEISKWLSVSFRVEDSTYTYLLAPPT